jgi:hypothetical protein
VIRLFYEFGLSAFWYNFIALSSSERIFYRLAFKGQDTLTIDGVQFTLTSLQVSKNLASCTIQISEGSDSHRFLIHYFNRKKVVKTNSNYKIAWNSNILKLRKNSDKIWVTVVKLF